MRVLNVLGVIALGCYAPTASAGIVLSVDLDPLTAGIQSSRAYGAGNTVQANFVLELTAPTRISAYNFSVRFDTSELAFVSRAEAPGTIAGWSEIRLNSMGSSNGLQIEFDAQGPTLTGPQGPFVVASAIFTAVAPSGSAGELDIEVGPFNPTGGIDGFIDETFVTFVPNDQINYQSASVNVVPEPSSMMLGMFALVCCIAYRARRQHEFSITCDM